jgi:hypothetical protein
MSEAPPPPAPRGSPAGRFVGLVVLSIGVLVLSFTGLCTVVALATLIPTDGLGDIMLILPFTFVGVVVGGVIYMIGRSLRPQS